MSQDLKAYSLLVGLGAIDSESNYYRRHLAGFNGRSGCQGCLRDVEAMNSLTHYLGYERVTPKPLLNRRATIAGVKVALRGAVSELNKPTTPPGSILFVYFTCHGRYFGESTEKRNTLPTASFINRPTNMLLLHDGPIFNFEILEELSKICAPPTGKPKHRVFTVFDCCHAGLGANAGAESFLSTQSQLPDWMNPGATSEGSHAPLLEQMDQRISGNISNQLSQKLELIHYGAAWDLLTARGGPDGSVFTKLMRRIIIESGHEVNYVSLFCAMARMMPERHQPGWESIPQLNPTTLCSTNPGSHLDAFHLQSPLSI